jgi:hypothetical protein
MVGRPVRFVGAETEQDDDFAVSRLREAFTPPALSKSISKWSRSPPPAPMNPRSITTN